MAFYFIKSEHELPTLAALEGAPVIGLDIETAGKNGLRPQQSRIRLVQIAAGEDRYVIDLDRVNPMDTLRPLFESPDTIKVLHHAKFDVSHILHHYHIEVKNIFCTMLASRLLAKGKSQRHGLADVSKRVLGRHIDKSLQNSDWSGALSESQIQYAATDAELALELYHEMDAQIRKEKLKRVSSLEFRTVVPVAAMELKGIFVDRTRLNEVRDRLRQECEGLEERLLEELPAEGSLPGLNTLNINAPEQVKQALHHRGIEVPDTADSTLRPLVEAHPFLGDLLRHRHLTKIITSTLDSLTGSILLETGRVHPHYHQIASASGRFACSDPNIQQVPREKEVRACIRPEPGYRYIVADYSQVELRVAAGLARDPIMLQAYADGKDLHRLTAALTKGKPIEEITSGERQAAKAINFGLIYAMGPRGLQQSAKASYGVEMSPGEARMFRKRYFDNYRGIRQWQQNMERTGRLRGYVRTAAGRIRSYRGEEIRITEMFNTPVQGTAAEGLKSALCIFWEKVKTEGLDAHVVAIIHDEIIVEVAQDQAEQTKIVLEQSMIEGISWLVPNVPFEVEAQIGDSWAIK